MSVIAAYDWSGAYVLGGAIVGSAIAVLCLWLGGKS